MLEELQGLDRRAEGRLHQHPVVSGGIPGLEVEGLAGRITLGPRRPELPRSKPRHPRQDGRGSGLRAACAWRPSMKRLGIASRMTFVFGLIAVTQVGIAALGLRGFHLSNDALGIVYHQRLVPVSELSRINELMHTSIEQLTIAVIARPSPKNVQVYIDRVEKNLAEIGALAQKY